MGKFFNVSANCRQELHYMVDIRPKLEKIKDMVDLGQYFTINRARQYGKTTTLKALERFLRNDYVVVSLDFQMISASKFRDENIFSVAFAREFLEGIADEESVSLQKTACFLETALQDNKEEIELFELFKYLNQICAASPKPVVLMVDEVDSAANNQVFLDFLAQLRGSYIKRDIRPTFHSVILAGVYDIKNIKQKIRPDDEHKVNSPWNIAADFLVDMSFSASEIAGMLADYEEDWHTGMNTGEIAGMLYDYTSGYPFLVSRICKLIDERIVGSAEFPEKSNAWTKAGFLEAVKLLLAEKNTLFESLTGKLNDYPELKKVIYLLLFQGQSIVYNPDDNAVNVAIMFGFVKEEQRTVVIANRIFEVRLYNLFLTSSDVQSNDIYKVALQDKNQFVLGGQLNMKLVLEKFLIHFSDLFDGWQGKFLEEDGRRLFLLYLRPIINGVGNYYIESQTRDSERTDVIVDYHGEQFVIELKIWRGNAYNERGEEQLLDYLDYYHLKKGYMLSFNFNKNKRVGVSEVLIGDKILIEAIV